MCKLGVHVSIHKSGQRGLFGEKGGDGGRASVFMKKATERMGEEMGGGKNSPLV